MNRSPQAGWGGLLALCLLLGAVTAGAAPRYTDRETALELAKALDKAVFRGHLVSSTFIQKSTDDRYFIKVVLDDSVSQDWTIDQLHTWSRDEEILLQGNRVLLFPVRDSSRFVVLEKNAFARRALTAKVYAKRHGPGDPLAGRTIHFEIAQFNLAELVGVTPGHDGQGYRHHFLLDLVNGQREFLSYLDAQEVLSRNGLIAEPGESLAVMGRPYRLSRLLAHPTTGKDEDGIARFGVELIFDRPLGLEPGDFPIQMYERSEGSKTHFVVEMTVPNAELAAPVSPIPQLEYLSAVNAVADAQHPKRVLLQARLNPDVLDLPPEVRVADRSVTVQFLKVVDQSVLARRELYELDLRQRQERLMGISVSKEEARQRKDYRQFFETGLAQWDKARETPDFEAKSDLMTTALANFQEAALHATSDRELEEALRQRNTLQARVPLLILDHVRAQLEQEPVPNPERLIAHLTTAAAMTHDPEVLALIREFARRLGH